jgi:hypothetical protein
MVAAAMVHGYDIAHRRRSPACTFGATTCRRLSGALQIKRRTAPRRRSIAATGLNHGVGDSIYGVLKLPSDPPHWSTTGH